MILRSHKKELLDEDKIPKKDLYQNLRELHIINKWLGGYSLSVEGLKKIVNQNPQVRLILDIGFGGGDFLKALSIFSNLNNFNLKFIGVDIKADCVAYAKENLKGNHQIELLESDYRIITNDIWNKVDVVHASLFFHHLLDSEILELLRMCKANNCVVLVNDLQRHNLARLSITALTQLFSKSYLVKNDAPLSVSRGFTKGELQQLFHSAGYTKVDVNWVWAFRYRVIAWK